MSAPRTWTPTSAATRWPVSQRTSTPGSSCTTRPCASTRGAPPQQQQQQQPARLSTTVPQQQQGLRPMKRPAVAKTVACPKGRITTHMGTRLWQVQINYRVSIDLSSAQNIHFLVYFRIQLRTEFGLECWWPLDPSSHGYECRSPLRHWLLLK